MTPAGGFTGKSRTPVWIFCRTRLRGFAALVLACHWTVLFRYCRFYLGRRIDDDERQIGRWKGVAGKSPMA